MPLKTWAPYDRLTAEDLNGATAYLAGQGLALPGAVGEVAGPAISITTNQSGELDLGQPAAGMDPLGYWQSTGRLKVPAGLGGVHLLAATLQGTAPNGTTTATGAFAQAVLVGGIGAGVGEPVATWQRYESAGVQGSAFALIRSMADQEEWYIQVIPRVADGVSVRVVAWSILRLASLVGGFGA